MFRKVNKGGIPTSDNKALTGLTASIVQSLLGGKTNEKNG